jgi:hypothetical protein
MMIKRVEALKWIAADRFNSLTLSRFNGDGSLDEWTPLLIDAASRNMAGQCAGLLLPARAFFASSITRCSISRGISS